MPASTVHADRATPLLRPYFAGAMLAVLTLDFLQKAGFATELGWSRAREAIGILCVIPLLFVCERYA